MAGAGPQIWAVVSTPIPIFYDRKDMLLPSLHQYVAMESILLDTHVLTILDTNQTHTLINKKRHTPISASCSRIMESRTVYHKRQEKSIWYSIDSFDGMAAGELQPNHSTAQPTPDGQSPA